MINNNKKDLVSEALKELSNYIHKRNQQADNQNDNRHLVDCAKEIRKACIEQKEVDFWDDWFERAKFELSVDLYHMMKVSGLGYINKSN